MARDLLYFAPKQDDARYAAPLRIGRALEEFELAIGCACSVEYALTLRAYLSGIAEKAAALEQQALDRAAVLCEAPVCSWCGQELRERTHEPFCSILCGVAAETDGV